MSIKHCWLFFLGVMVAVLPIPAQQFFSLNWQELPPAHTLPLVTRALPLPDKETPLHTYHPVLEYPEYSPLTFQECVALQASLDSLKQLSPEIHPIVLRNALAGSSLPESPCLQGTVGVSADRPSLYVSLLPVVLRDGVYQRLRSFKLSYTITPSDATDALSRSAAMQSHATAPAVTRSALSRSEENTASLLSTGNWVKIRVTQSGVHKISHATLRKMGFSRPEKVRVFGYGGHLLSQRFNEHPEGELPEVPLLTVPNGILFHARGTVSWKQLAGGNLFMRERNFYSDEAYYFLTDREDIPKPEALVQTETLPAAEHVLTTFNDYALYEKDGYSWAGTGRHLYEDYDYAAGNTKNYELTLPGIVADASATLTAVFAARAINTSSICMVSVDGTLLRTTSIPSISSDRQYYTRATSVTMQIPLTGVKSEKPLVTIRHERPSGVSGRLDYLAINYIRLLRLSSSYLEFRSLSSIGKESTFVVSGATPSTVVWDVTNPSAIQAVPGSYADGAFTFTIPAGTLREFVAVNPEETKFPEVTAGERVVNQNLHGLAATDMVIVVPDREYLITQARRLAQAHRAKDGLKVEIVTAPQVYNEFSSGTPDATAYRRLMKMLYERFPAAERSRYLLLFGDCSYDNRMLTGSWKQYSPGDFLLSYQSENSLEETTSYITDDYFGFLDDSEGANLASDLLDIGIGRLPVRTAEEARAVVDKTIAYMNNQHAGAWKNSICYVADDGDSNLHMRQSDLLASYTETNYPSMLVHRVYADAFKREDTATGNSYPEATKRLKQLLNRGLLMVNYTGHGSTTAWAEENLLTSGDIEELTSPRLPLWVTATCDFTRFDDAATSAGERALLNPKGGAIALFTTTRVVYASQNSTLNRAFLRHVFTRPNGSRLRLGDVMRLAKCDETLFGDRNKLNFSLIGDPALMLAYPEYKVVIDEFAGVDVRGEDASHPMVKAGMKVKVKGHVLTPEGAPADDFTGLLFPTVLDSNVTTTTLNNNKQGAFTYEERGKTLYAGSDSVRGGAFEFVFPVPFDISYSEKAGMLNLYALAGDGLHEAAGSFNRFGVGGTADNIEENDGEGPQMKLYLNSPDFVSGGKTNPTPMLVAELEDEDGINTVGAGIGHDLWLRINGNAHLTYALNDYFHSAAGDYTRGTVRFSLPELPEGRHTLAFRAWDLRNNSSLRTLDFEVVRGLNPSLLSLSCTHSPARESTTFVLSHNRPGSVLTVRISVYDVSGREQWSHTEKSLTEDETRYVEWDLCSNEGQRLAPGVYLYSAAISADGSSEAVQSRKLIILAN